MKSIGILLLFSAMNQGNPYYLFNFQSEKNTAQWFVVDDGVMGGLSQGEMFINDAGNGLFKGYVTTENNGGFSSVRYKFNKKDVSKFKQVILKIKGDGKSYQFRIKESYSQRYSFITTFKTSGQWQIIKIPFSSFYPSFRGYDLDKPNYSGETMEEIAFLIGNKKKESFALEIENIVLE